jgi:hypothetical protein
MLSHVGLGKEFWAEVINTAYYLVNRSYNTSIKSKLFSYEYRVVDQNFYIFFRYFF